MTGHTAVYAVIGRPIQHSGSPALHNAWFQALNIDAVYVALDVAPKDGASVLPALRTLHLAGVNLTVPHKRAVLPYLDAMDSDVQAIGAANTLVREGERWIGHNTDAKGFVNGFIAKHGNTLSGRRTLILGAGGAAAAVCKGLLDAGVENVVLCNRTVSRAEDIAERMGPRASAHALAQAPSLAMGVDLVINALAGDGIEHAAAIRPETLTPKAVWCDLNYWMPNPPNRDACAKAGIAFLPGGPMLAHQAALAFQHFTGMSPPRVPKGEHLE